MPTKGKDDADRQTPGTAAPDRRATDHRAAGGTEIGPGTVFRGDLNSSDPVEIRGTLEGDCRTTARCVVHETARVLGNIDAVALIVAGRVEAGLLSAEKIELRPTAHVVGTLRARMLVIADGAYYSGDIEQVGLAGPPPVLKDRRSPPHRPD